MAISLFDQLGGKTTLIKVHKDFYDRLFEHDWLKNFFVDVDQTILENQQTNFMSEAMGGPKCYAGKLPILTHKHMYITDEIFELRHNLLKESILKCGVTPELCKNWLNIDRAFQGSIVKQKIEDCQKRYNTDTILAVSKPTNV